MFGPHLILDCHDCNSSKLSNKALIEQTLDDLVVDMNMTKILGPNVFEYKGVVPDDWGYTGITIIAESHLAIHTFPDKRHMFVDVFSCKDFDTRIVIDKLVKAFDIETWDEQLIQRGREFPKSMTKAKLILDNERTQVLQSLV